MVVPRPQRSFPEADRNAHRIRSMIRACQHQCPKPGQGMVMIRKLPSGSYRLYSRKSDPKTGRRRNLGTFSSRAQALKHERAVQYFKHA